METCANCEREIGNLEAAHVHDGRVVCGECKGKLSPVATAVIDYQANGWQPAPKAARSCPACGSMEEPVRRPKGSMMVMAFLFCLGILPGVLYALIYSGNNWVCRNCGLVIGTATEKNESIFRFR